MKTTPDITSGSIAAQWRHHLRHASRAYWIAQGVLAGLLVLFSLAMMFGLTNPSDQGSLDPAHVVLRILFDTALTVAVLHVAVRPVLLIWFVNRRLSLARALAGIAWLFGIGYAAFFLSIAIGRAMTPGDGYDIQQIQFYTPDGSFQVGLDTHQVMLLGGFNHVSLLGLWALLYLAWKAFESRRMLQQQVREARLRQLTHQLSPHFLFNAFNSIRGMIFEDRERAAELVTQLSELFRFHLGSEVRTQVTLAEDWEIARRYLDIEAVRLEDRMRLEVDLDPSLVERTLPTMTLLTLVENAVKHGIAPNREGGRLSLLARPADRGWRLEVENSMGPGMAEYSGGHGLASLRERLALTLGEEALLRVVQDDGRFLVLMEFPR